MKVRRGWMKPPEGKLKVNVDASFAAGMGSTGVVIRDSGGGFIAASVSFFCRHCWMLQWQKLML